MGESYIVYFDYIYSIRGLGTAGPYLIKIATGPEARTLAMQMDSSIFKFVPTNATLFTLILYIESVWVENRGSLPDHNRRGTRGPRIGHANGQLYIQVCTH